MGYVGKREVYTEQGPSGRVYEYHVASTPEFAEAYGGLPALDPGKGDYDGPREIEFKVRLFVRCVVNPVVVRDGDTGPAEGEWLYFSDIPNEDAVWLTTRITARYAVDKADQMRRAL